MDLVSLLEEAQAAGLSVEAQGDKLVVTGPADAEPVALKLLEQKNGVMALLRGREAANTERALEGLEWVLNVLPAALPSPPFPLNSSMTVTDPERFLRSLRLGIEEGPRGPRARTGALQKQCRELRIVIQRREGGEAAEENKGHRKSRGIHRNRNNAGGLLVAHRGG